MIIAVSQINSRHIFLKSLIGTKEEEDYSYENANSLLWTTTCLFFLFSVLEVVFFYLYNNKVTFLKIQVLSFFFIFISKILVSPMD